MQNPHAELRVDDRPIEVRGVDRIFQSDRYPGGHRYVLTIRASDVRRRFPGLHSAALHVPTRAETEALFLDLLVAFRDEWSGAREVRFLLNNITEVAAEEGEIRFSGVCSEVVRLSEGAVETVRDRS